jgi:hypothetical protein
VQLVLQHVERLSQVALPPLHIGHHQDVVPAGLRLAHGLIHELAGVDRCAGVGDQPLGSALDETQLGDGPVLEGALARRAEAILLAGRALTNPATAPQTCEFGL